jgi:hypothetical protein
VKRVRFICASVLMLFTSVVYADPAFIITEGSCRMADGDGGSITSTDVKQVNSNSPKNGNITLKCYATGVDNSTGKVVKYNFENTGAFCDTFETFPELSQQSTDDWKEVVSADGDAVLTCKFHNDWVD